MNLDSIKKLSLGQAKEERIIALIKVCERNHITYNLQKMARLSRADLVTLKYSCLGGMIPPWAKGIVKNQDESNNQIQSGDLCQVTK